EGGAAWSEPGQGSGVELPAGAAGGSYRGRGRGRGRRPGPAPQGRSQGVVGGVMPNVLAIAEQRDGALRKVSHEVVSAARTVADALSGDVHVLVLGPAGLAEAAAELGRFGADKIFVGESEGFRHSNPDGVTKAIVDLATANGYHTV